MQRINEPITQSKAWQKLQEDLKEESFYKETESYHYLAILNSTPVGNYLFLPYGPVAKDPESFQGAIRSITDLAKKHHAIFVRLEPQNRDFQKLLPKNSKRSKDINPADTWQLDLTKNREELIKNFSQGTRTRFNNYAKKGLYIEKTTDPQQIRHLVTMQQALAKVKHIGTFSEEYLTAELSQPFATLYLVKYRPPSGMETRPDAPPEDVPIAASLFFDHKGTRYYMQSAADSKYRKFPATVALLTEAIFDAKEQGSKTFDFWGIAPEGASSDHPWAGFTEFKKSFGGHPVHYCGTYDIILKPAKYKAYQSLRKYNRYLKNHK